MSGDTGYTKFDPEVPGVGNFELWSDDEIDGFIAAAAGHVTRAIGYGYLALAARAAVEARSVADYDLKLDTTKTPDALRSTANYYFMQANEEDKRDGGGDIFEVFDTVGHKYPRRPEAVIGTVFV